MWIAWDTLQLCHISMLDMHKIFHSQVFSERLLDVCGMINELECTTAGKHRDLNAPQFRKREELSRRL